MAKYVQRDPTMPRRGRKPVREDVYITTSLQKIEKMERQLKDEAGRLTTKERDELRNKASALRSRVNRKLESRKNQSQLETMNARFSDLANLMIDEMDHDCRERIILKLAAKLAPTKRARQANPTYKVKVNKQDILKVMKEFVNGNDKN